ncbi:MAG: cytochrome c oxidase assembly factor Coa1 family protein [Terriglobus sp.]
MHLPRTKAKRSNAVFAVQVALVLSAFIGAFFVISVELGDLYGRDLPFLPAAMQTVNGSHVAQDQLGESIQMRWPIDLQAVSTSDGGGHATLTIPVRGTKDHGTLNIQAVQDGDGWTTQKISLTPSGSNKAVVLMSSEP